MCVPYSAVCLLSNCVAAEPGWFGSHSILLKLGDFFLHDFQMARLAIFSGECHPNCPTVEVAPFHVAGQRF